MSKREINIHQRHFLKAKDIKQFITDLKVTYPETLVDDIITPKSKVEWIKIDNDEELYGIDDLLMFWKTEGKYIPLLSLLMKKRLPFKFVKVDKGAIPYVSNGADVMRPGILTIDPTIQKDDVVTIQDPIHGKVLSVGISLFNAAEMQAMTKGKVIKAVHALNDSIWTFSKNFK